MTRIQPLATTLVACVIVGSASLASAQIVVSGE